MRISYLLILPLFFLNLRPCFSQEYEVQPCAFNTPYNEFAPAFYDRELLFCSDKKVHAAISRIDAEGKFPSGIYLAKSAQSMQSQLLAPEFLTRLNTGPSYYDKKNQTLWFGRTITSGTNKAQGLFYTQLQNGVWSEPKAFEHNSDDAGYSIAYPFITEDNNYLYFTSDMQGGSGLKDLYRCARQSTGWSAPENLGPEVNTPKNEISPYIDSSGKLYFSSDSDPSGSDYDIFYVLPEQNNFKYKQILPAPVNSPFDDFSMIVGPDGESGFLSSNRNNNQDDIFSFKLMYPVFESCPPAELPTFCYLFEETELLPNDTMPLIFEWEFGDGKKQNGLSAEHCYEDYGSYHVQLNVYDSLTRIQFARVSEVDVVINKSPFPFITSPDSCMPQQAIKLTTAGTDLDNFEIDQIFWDLGDGKKIKADSLEYIYEKPGYYTVTVGMISQPVEGKTMKTCATKIISVGTFSELSEFENPNESLATRESALQNDMRFVDINSDPTELKYTPDSTLFYVQFKESEQQLEPESPYFQDIKYEITERFDNKDTLYKYSIGNTTEIPALVKMYKELMDAGYTASLVSEKKVDQFERETVKRWWYIPDSLEAGMNRHLNKFNDITFDYNAHNIRTESFDDLRYISEVLKQQKLLKLEIVAHTDSIGSDDHNMSLSNKRAEAVVNYLIQSGVESDRLISKGYGESKPIADNGSEVGRAVNRRVEFVILREDKK